MRTPPETRCAHSGSGAMQLAALVVLCVAACSTSSGSSPAPSCPELSNLESSADIDATPRPDADAELLALLFGDSVTADPALYARVAADLAAIRALDESIADLRARVSFDSRHLSLIVDDARPMRDHVYHDWDCLNAHYGWIRTTVLVYEHGDGFASVELKGRYATDLLACRYAHLPHVGYAEAGSYDGDGSGVFGFIDDDGSTLHYAFDRAGGDCAVACTTHSATHYTSDALRAITQLEHFEGTNGAAMPTWLFRARARRVRMCP
jgi:hypothetical protein